MQSKRPPMKRDEMINYCYEILRRKGHSVERFVETGINGGSLKADLVTRTTVYEFRENLTRTALFEGTGQGLVYAWWLGRRRLVVVGYLPQATADQGVAITTAANIERTGYARISFVDVDPFWELATPSYRPLGYVALLVGAIALAVFAIPLFREEVGCRVYPEWNACTFDRVYRPQIDIEALSVKNSEVLSIGLVGRLTPIPKAIAVEKLVRVQGCVKTCASCGFSHNP